MRRVRFGIIVGNRNALDRILELAKLAERYNFDHYLLSDHYWYPEASDLLDSWAVISYLSGITSTIRLGTCVTPITFRPPAQFAKFVTTLDNATKGRIIVGVGAGWLEEEFRMFSKWYPNKVRFEQLKEALQILVDAWSKGKVTFHGDFYNVENCVVEPTPVQKPHPPLWFGGWGAKILRLAGRIGSGWVSTGPRSGEGVKNSEEYKQHLQKIRGGLVESGRSEQEFTFGCRFGPFADQRDHLREVEDFASIGLNCYQLGLDARKDQAEIIRKFADTVMTCF